MLFDTGLLPEIFETVQVYGRHQIYEETVQHTVDVGIQLNRILLVTMNRRTLFQMLLMSTSQITKLPMKVFCKGFSQLALY